MFVYRTYTDRFRIIIITLSLDVIKQFTFIACKKTRGRRRQVRHFVGIFEKLYTIKDEQLESPTT